MTRGNVRGNGKTRLKRHEFGSVAREEGLLFPRSRDTKGLCGPKRSNYRLTADMTTRKTFFRALMSHHPNRGGDIARLMNRDLLLAVVPFIGLTE